jgi:hypothetical protein
VLKQIFSSGALRPGSGGYWFLIVFVAGVISLSILVMFLIIIFESYRAIRYSNLYKTLTYVAWSACRLVCAFPLSVELFVD